MYVANVFFTFGVAEKVNKVRIKFVSTLKTRTANSFLLKYTILSPDKTAAVDQACTMGLAHMDPSGNWFGN